MPRYTGKIRGTINDDFDVEADNEEMARELALMEWRYVEFEDLEVASITHEVGDGLDSLRELLP